MTVHQGCGLTNAMTGITEAAKSRTPLLVLAAEVTGSRRRTSTSTRPRWPRGGRRAAAGHVGGDAAVDEALARLPHRASTSGGPWCSTCRWTCRAGAAGRRTPGPRWLRRGAARGTGRRTTVGRLAELLERARRRPVFVAGRGARARVRGDLEALAEACGALLATSAVANGLFHGNPWSLDVSGGFASPLAAELIGGPTSIVGWGCALNMWTMRHGRLIGADADAWCRSTSTPTRSGALPGGPISAWSATVASTAAALAADLARSARAGRATGRRELRRQRIAARDPLARRPVPTTDGRRPRSGSTRGR